MANKKKRVRRTKAQIEADNAKLAAQQDMKSEGLGDTVEKVFEATGVKAVVKAIFGDDCGCDERKAKLNKWFPYKIECLEESEYNYLHSFFSRNPNEVKPSEQIELVKIARRVFNKNYEVSGCAGCVRDLVNRLRTVYETYEEDNE